MAHSWTPELQKKLADQPAKRVCWAMVPETYRELGPGVPRADSTIALRRMNDVTRVLSAIEQGNPHAAEQLLPLVHDELGKLAAQKLAGETPGQTLDATALVHEIGPTPARGCIAGFAGTVGPNRARLPARRIPKFLVRLADVCRTIL
jgi:hypothetical protein